MGAACWRPDAGTVRHSSPSLWRHQCPISLSVDKNATCLPKNIWLSVEACCVMFVVSTSAQLRIQYVPDVPSREIAAQIDSELSRSCRAAPALVASPRSIPETEEYSLCIIPHLCYNIKTLRDRCSKPIQYEQIRLDDRRMRAGQYYYGSHNANRILLSLR